MCSLTSAHLGIGAGLVVGGEGERGARHAGAVQAAEGAEQLRQQLLLVAPQVRHHAHVQQHDAGAQPLLRDLRRAQSIVSTGDGKTTRISTEVEDCTMLRRSVVGTTQLGSAAQRRAEMVETPGMRIWEDAAAISTRVEGSQTGTWRPRR